MSKLDVLFVHPNGAAIIYQKLSETYSAIEPPIWSALLANHVRAKGYSTSVLDCEAERLTIKESADKITAQDPKLIAVVVYGQQPSASTQNMYGASLLCKKLKEDNEELKIVLIGLHPSAVSRETIQQEVADFVCQGEGLYTVTGLLSIDMNKTSELQKVPGLWYRDRGVYKMHEACAHSAARGIRR